MTRFAVISLLGLVTTIANAAERRRGPAKGTEESDTVRTMRSLALDAAALLLLAATMATGPCYAVDMGLRPDQFGDAVTRASMRQGTNIDWGTPVCGEPKYLSSVCVWSMTDRFDLTTHALKRKQPDRVILAILRWRHKNDKPVGEARAFEKMCAALFGRFFSRRP